MAAFAGIENPGHEKSPWGTGTTTLLTTKHYNAQYILADCDCVVSKAMFPVGTFRVPEFIFGIFSGRKPAIREFSLGPDFGTKGHRIHYSLFIHSFVRWVCASQFSMQQPFLQSSRLRSIDFEQKYFKSVVHGANRCVRLV